MDHRDLVARQKEQFGGMKFGSAFFGWLTATGLTVLLVAALTAAGTAVGVGTNTSLDEAADIATQDANTTQTVGLAGGIAVLVVLLIAYYCGGYVAAGWRASTASVRASRCGSGRSSSRSSSPSSQPSPEVSTTSSAIWTPSHASPSMATSEQLAPSRWAQQRWQASSERSSAACRNAVPPQGRQGSTRPTHVAGWNTEKRQPIRSAGALCIGAQCHPDQFRAAATEGTAAAQRGAEGGNEVSTRTRVNIADIADTAV